MLRFLKVLDYCLLAIAFIFPFVVVNDVYSQTSGIGTVVDNFTIPIPQPSGICSDGESFWISNYSAVTGGQEIYRLDIRTHQVTDSIRALDSTPTGLAYDGRGIWVMSTYPYNPYRSPGKTSLVKLSTSDSILGYIPAKYTCYWAGIAWDGKDLYYGTNICFASPKGEKSMIYKVNPKTGAVLASFPPPSGNINGLVYNKGHLWYCDDNYKYIFEIDTTGQIVREFPAYGGLLSGITIAKGYLWAVDMAGVNGARIYEIDIGEAPEIPQDLSCGPKALIRAIRLSWKPSTSNDVVAYRIYRGTSADSLGSAVLIASVPSNVTSYIDTTVPNGIGFAYWVSAVDTAGVESHVSNVATGNALPNLRLKLRQNYPNPFNSATTIAYEVPPALYSSTRKVNIAVYDVLGRKVAILVDKNVGPGDKTVTFDGSGLPSGVYFCRMQSGSFSKTIKLVLIR